jgi:hypothetical protein
VAERKTTRPERASRRGSLLLALGAAVGIGLALAQIAGQHPSADALPAGAVALVNGAPIRSDDYERALAGLANDRRTPIGEADKRHVLDRLIEEELLLQRGIELELVRRDPRVRGDLVSTVVDGVASEASAREPSPAEVEAFYRANGELFARAGRVRARQIVVKIVPGRSEEDARLRAAAAVARLRAGEDFAVVAHELGDVDVVELPDALLPTAKLVEYLGPTAAREALDLKAGSVSEPIRSGAGYTVLDVLERDSTTVPPLADVEPQVRAELRRKAAEDALRAYLDQLRAKSDVRVSGALP